MKNHSADLSAADDWIRDDRKNQHFIATAAFRSLQMIDRVLHTWWETDTANVKSTADCRMTMKKIKQKCSSRL